ncbi:MAG: substrate-binding domain-containing protein [Anaerolineales bacterium]|nr:substrate-binding domain-containing protein [Anaerolineales bacterium]
MSKRTGSTLFSWFFAFFTLMGCSAAQNPESFKPPPPVKVLVSPAVSENWLDFIGQCFEESGQHASFLKEDQSSLPFPGEFDLFLWWGDPTSYPAIEDADLMPLSLGTLELSLIVNNQNQLSNLSKTEISSIFTGKINSWDSLPASGLSSPIQTWVYPQENSIQDVFQRSLLEDAAPAGTSRVAPSPSAVIQAVQKDPASIGFIIEHKTYQGIHYLDIQPDIPGVEHPLLLLLPPEAIPDMTPVLNCLAEKN